MSPGPRVLVLGTVLGQGMGGVRRHNQELLPRLAAKLEDRGGSLSVLEGQEPCAFALPETIERIPSDIPARPILRRSIQEGETLRKLLHARHQEGRPFHWVHTAHQPVPRDIPAALSLLVHDLRNLRRGHSPFSRRFVARNVIGRAVRQARLLMTVSEAMAEEMAELLRIPRDIITVIPNGADHFQPAPRAALAEGPLLCVGHLEARKNQELLLRALALDEGLPDLDLVGSPKGDERARLGRLADELGVGRRVNFLETVDDEQLKQLYARTRCVVLPSRLEGFGIVAVEALRAGAPLAVSRIPAHQEVCPPGVPSFSDDPADCARALREAMGLPQRKLLEFQQSTERYRWQASADRLVESWCGEGTT